MTVPSETNHSGPYNGNGVTTVFDYGFRIISQTHLRVIKTIVATGVETTLTLDSDYSVSGVGDAAGGQITMVAAPATGETITILRNVPFTQETDLENQGAYYAETVEGAFDLAVMRDQELQEKVERSVKSPYGTVGPDLPEASPDKLIGWNTAGDRLENKTLVSMGDVELTSDIAGGSPDKAANPAGVKAYVDALRSAATILLHLDGQSNMAISWPKAWTPSPNYKRWNNANNEASVGTEFVDPSSTTINLPDAIGSYIASLLPTTRVYGVVSSLSGKTIDHWRIGIPMIWESDITGSAPADGTIKINNASPALATSLYASTKKSTGNTYNSAITLLNAADCAWIRIEKADDPSIYVEYDPGTFIYNVTDFELPITYIGHAGTLVDTDAVRFRIGPDVLTVAENNVPAACAAAGLAAPSFYMRMQGEGDVLEQFDYINDFNEVLALYQSEGIHDEGTQTAICGIVSTAINSNAFYDLMNWRLQRCVHGDPDHRIFVNTASIGAEFWEPGVPNLVHLSADGQVAAGKLIGENIVYGARRPVPYGLSTEIGNGTFHIDAETVASEIRGAPLQWTLSGEVNANFDLRVYDDVGVPALRISKARGKTGSGATAVQVNDALGVIDFMGHTGGGQYIKGARILSSVIQATPSATEFGSRLSLQATAMGTAALADMLQMDSLNGLMAFGTGVFIDTNRNFRLRSYTVATLPAGVVSGTMVFVSDALGGSIPAFNVGATWLRVDDRAVVS